MVYYVFILNQWDSLAIHSSVPNIVLFSNLLSVGDFFQPVVLVVLSQNMEKTPFV